MLQFGAVRTCLRFVFLDYLPFANHDQSLISAPALKGSLFAKRQARPELYSCESHVLEPSSSNVLGRYRTIIISLISLAFSSTACA